MVPRTRPISRTTFETEREPRPLLRRRDGDNNGFDSRGRGDSHNDGEDDSGDDRSGGGSDVRRRDSADTDWLGPGAERESALSPYLPERWRGARVDPGRGGVLALGAVGVVVLLVAGYALLRDAPTSAPVPALPVVQPLSSTPAATDPAVVEPPTHIVVSVVGLVASSGLVRLPAGSRVADALHAAGGPLGGADVLALNLAAKVEDGDQIVVGATPPEGKPIVSGTMPEGSGGTGAAGGPSSTPGTGTGTVNLNSATPAELDSLSGVGPVTAANIVAWRETNGPFTTVEQLGEVDGIGPARLEKLREQVTV